MILCISLTPHLGFGAFADQPSDCPTFSLLNKDSLAGPLRRTQQKFGICYVHASARALDYLNYSTGNPQPRTSILSTAMQVNTKVTGKTLDLEAGSYQEAVVEQLRRKGGCSETAWDRLPLSAGEEKLIGLQTAIAELNATLTALQEANQTAISKSISTWSAATREIVGAAISPDVKNLTEGFQKLNLGQILSAIGKISLLARDYQIESIKQGPYHFMSFANFVMEKAFCRKPEVKYTASTLMHLAYVIYEESRPEPTELRDRIREHFESPNPQPIMLSFFADQLNNLEATTKFAPHAALIVGQRFDQATSTCRYQLLDSSDPKDYDPRLKVDLETGSMWLRLGPIASSFFVMSYLQPQ